MSTYRTGAELYTTVLRSNGETESGNFCSVRNKISFGTDSSYADGRPYLDLLISATPKEEISRAALLEVHMSTYNTIVGHCVSPSDHYDGSLVGTVVLTKTGSEPTAQKLALRIVRPPVSCQAELYLKPIGCTLKAGATIKVGFYSGGGV